MDPDDDTIDLDQWTPAGKATVDYAVELLRSTQPAEIRGAHRWLLAHPAEARPTLEAALATPSAQAAAVLLGFVGDGASLPPLIDAFARGGEGLRSAVRTGLETMVELGVDGAEQALASLPDRG